MSLTSTIRSRVQPINRGHDGANLEKGAECRDVAERAREIILNVLFAFFIQTLLQPRDEICNDYDICLEQIKCLSFIHKAPYVVMKCMFKVST